MSTDTREALAAAEVGLANLVSYQSSGNAPSIHKYGQARRALEAVPAALAIQPAAPAQAVPNNYVKEEDC